MRKPGELPDQDQPLFTSQIIECGQMLFLLTVDPVVTREFVLNDSRAERSCGIQSGAGEIDTNYVANEQGNTNSERGKVCCSVLIKYCQLKNSIILRSLDRFTFSTAS